MAEGLSRLGSFPGSSCLHTTTRTYTCHPPAHPVHIASPSGILHPLVRARFATLGQLTPQGCLTHLTTAVKIPAPRLPKKRVLLVLQHLPVTSTHISPSSRSHHLPHLACYRLPPQSYKRVGKLSSNPLRLRVQQQQHQLPRLPLDKPRGMIPGCNSRPVQHLRG